MPLSKEQLRQSKLRMGTIRQAREAVKGARERETQRGKERNRTVYGQREESE